MSLPETIKALQVQSDKTVKVIEIPFVSQDLVKNLPEDQVIIRVCAVGLNPTDWKHALGSLGTPGTISGCDAAGDVVKVGSAVKHLKVGDRAAGFTHGGATQTENGAYAEYVRFVSAVCFKLPDGMSYEEAASFPIPHLTVVQALYVRFSLPKPFSPNPKSEYILIWGGSTAVGHHAIQLASLSGLRPIVTASPSAFDEIKALGAVAVFDYKDPEVSKKIQAAAGQDGVIYGFDTVCEKGSTDACVDSISPIRGGHVVATLPISEEIQNRRKDVKVEFTLVYTELGYGFVFGHQFTYPPMPEDKARTLEHVSEYMPRLLEGWVEGKGATIFKTQKLRKLEGGLGKIQEGLEIMRDGKYAREKLVYSI